MANFEPIIKRVLAAEGGSKVTNDPADKGGLTKYGISQSAYPHLDIANLTEQQAVMLYRSQYWEPICGDQIVGQTAAMLIFDVAVNSGVAMAVTLAQRTACPQAVDGVMGPQTLIAINAMTRGSFAERFTLLRIEYYTKICAATPSQLVFLVGWINRAFASLRAVE